MVSINRNFNISNQPMLSLLLLVMCVPLCGNTNIFPLHFKSVKFNQESQNSPHAAL